MNSQEYTPAPEKRVTDKELGAKELAVKMLEWGELQEKANKLAEEIKAAVLISGKTQTVGNVRASYSNGRGAYDYERAFRDSGLTYDDIEPYQKVTYDYKLACAGLFIDHKPYYVKKSGPSVSIKLV